MNSSHLPRKMKLEWAPTSSDQPRLRGAALYGHAIYSYRKGVFMYRVEGTICDLTASACTIRGAIPQLVGTRIRVILSLYDQEKPLCVNGAIVTWFAGESFGLKFPQLKQDDAIRLQEYTRVLKTPG
jgi:hypothetical protein